ncbi:hypothetical protein ABEB36_012009 [Hypothenemus hampei]|uniref:Uncharacterized protein n=1 Tax=Hypothenemus hampei TaxID=57062 RepID=A0ABD1E9R4_HYPHA
MEFIKDLLWHNSRLWHRGKEKSNSGTLILCVVDPMHTYQRKCLEDVVLSTEPTDEDATQTPQTLGEKLNVGRQSISRRLCVKGKIEKTEKWVPH